MPVDPISGPLLDWYDANARALPWRLPPGAPGRADPYAVWLSEIMAQQTTVVVVARYWRRFLDLWPTVEALAAADEADVMREWAGLGYYARARNLLAAARIVAAAGGFPHTAAGLGRLPGVGPYTAAAIAAIAFNEPVAAVDANAERVGARLFAIQAPLPAARAAITHALQRHVPPARPGDFAQALMDLGATICTPRSPRCLLCPLAAPCAARRAGNADALPVKAPARARPLRRGIAWWITHGGDVALVRRPPRGLLGGMLALPGTDWAEALPDDPAPPFPARWTPLPGEVRHVFTHFELRLQLRATTSAVRHNSLDGAPILWTPLQDLVGAGLPTLYARAVALALQPEQKTP